MNLSFDQMYQASCDKNPDFQGVFWMGVKTTGIFCRPTCTARKPKPENVEFFDNTKEAILKVIARAKFVNHWKIQMKHHLKFRSCWMNCQSILRLSLKMLIWWKEDYCRQRLNVGFSNIMG